MTIVAGKNIIQECTPEQDDAANMAAYRIQEIGRLLGQFKPGYRFMVNVLAVEEEIRAQMAHIGAAAAADTPRKGSSS